MPDQIVPGRGGLQRFIETRSGEYAPEVYPQSAAGLAVATQRFYLAGSGKMTLGGAGTFKGVVQNPSGSGRMVYVWQITGYATLAGWARLWINPTAGVPTAAARPVTNAVIGASTGPVTTVRVEGDTSLTPVNLGGGSDTGIELGIPANTRFAIAAPPFILSPGVTLGINVPFAGAADVSLTAYWSEKDV